MNAALKKQIVNIALIVNLVLIVAVIVYAALGSRTDGSARKKLRNISAEDGRYFIIDEHKLAEFSDVLIEQFNEESKLIVYSADTSVQTNLTQTGIWDVEFMNKSQTVTYHGTGRFFIDMDKISVSSMSLDNDTKTVNIKIPHTELAEIEIVPEKFTVDGSKKGVLAFGELKFTAKEYNDLQIECKNRIKSSVDTRDNRDEADRRAVEELLKICEPVVKAVDDEYNVEISFIENPLK